MDTSLLQAAGLNDSLAACYVALLDHNQITPTLLAPKIKETRSNTYKLLDELVERGLAERFDYNKKLHYRATSPVQLLNLARERKDELLSQEKQLHQTVSQLLKAYYQQHEQPGVRFYQGKEGIKEIYLEQVRIGKPIQFLKTRADIEFFGFRFMHEVRNLARKAGITRKAFTPDAPEAPINTKESDKEMLLTRTWYQAQDYTAPVEWSAYGDKVSIVSYGQEAIGMVIDSPQIAESLRQIFGLLDEGLRRRPGYDKLPTRAEYKDVESFAEQYHNTTPSLPKDD